jgi:hypothetical protein
MLNNIYRLRKIKKQETTASPKSSSIDSLAPHDPVQIEREIEEQDSELLRIKGFIPK